MNVATHATSFARHGEVKLLLIEPSGTPNTGDPATAAPHIEV